MRHGYHTSVNLSASVFCFVFFSFFPFSLFHILLFPKENIFIFSVFRSSIFLPIFRCFCFPCNALYFRVNSEQNYGSRTCVYATVSSRSIETKSRTVFCELYMNNNNNNNNILSQFNSYAFRGTRTTGYRASYDGLSNLI